MNRLSIAAIGGAMLIGSSLPASAGYVVTVEQVGNDVVATGSGPIDLTGQMSPGFNNPSAGNSFGLINPGGTDPVNGHKCRSLRLFGQRTN
jgi:hypothetical protein